MRKPNMKRRLKTPGLEQETEEKLAGVLRHGTKQVVKTECPGLPSLDNPRSEFRETPSHLLSFIPTTKESFSSSFCGGMEQFFQCLTPALLLQLR